MGSFLVGGYLLVTGNSSVGFFLIGIAVVALIPMFIYWKMKLDVGGTAHFSQCQRCGREPSKTGNYTNLFLSGISNPTEFNHRYGMMCEQHASEVTEQIMVEKNLTKKDWEKAMQRAQSKIAKEIRQI